MRPDTWKDYPKHKDDPNIIIQELLSHGSWVQVEEE